MRNCFLDRTFSLILIIFVSVSYPQVVEKNGISYKNHQLNPESSQAINNSRRGIHKSFSHDQTSENPVNLPFIKTDFMVNKLDGEYGSDQFSISAAMDGNGNYACTWLDYRNGEKEIYAQFYNGDDEKISTNFKVNENSLVGNNSPFIAANKNGDFVIAWLQDFNNVMIQRYTSDGQRVGGNIIINTVWGMNTMEPSVAVNNNGSFLVVWASEGGEFNIYAKLFDKNGSALTSDIPVSEPGFNVSSIGQGKHIAVDNNGNYCITWSSYADRSFSNIFLQMINSSGQKTGSNTLVSSSNDVSGKTFPEIASTDDGHFLITWNSSLAYPNEGRVIARIYNSDNNFVTDEFIIYTDQNSWHPSSVSSDRDSTFLVFFSGSSKQYLQKIKKTGKFISDTIAVRYNSTEPFYSYNGGLTDIINGHFFIAPHFYERNDANIYLQKFNIDLEPVGNFNKIHDDLGSAWQRKSLVKFNNKGEAIILWEDKRNGRNDLYAQVLDKDLIPVGENIQINEVTSEQWFLHDKKVQYLSDGTFVIAFSGSESSDGTEVFLQLVDVSGKKIGNNKIIKGKSYFSNYKVELNVNSNDEILVCSYNQDGGYLRKFNKDITPLTSENNFIKYESSNPFLLLSISIDTSFDILAVWREYNNETYEYDENIKGKFFDKNGNAASEIFIIDNVNSYISNLSCKNDNHNYSVLYIKDYTIHLKRRYKADEEYIYDNTFYSYSSEPTQLNIVNFENQKVFITYNSMFEVFGFYANDNRRKTEFYKLHTYDNISPYYNEYNGTNSTDIFEDKLIFTYESSINGGTGYDIWSNVRRIENVNFNKEIYFHPANSDYLYPNYPNPFNPKTKIAYELLAYHKVKLAVYDVLGREVKVLVNENQEKGLYEVEFDATGLASGIYFLRLEAFDTTVRKMILVR